MSCSWATPLHSARWLKLPYVQNKWKNEPLLQMRKHWHVHLRISVQNISIHSGLDSTQQCIFTLVGFPVHIRIHCIQINDQRKWEGDRKREEEWTFFGVWIHNVYSTKPAESLYRGNQNTNTHRWSVVPIFNINPTLKAILFQTHLMCRHTVWHKEMER